MSAIVGECSVALLADAILIAVLVNRGGRLGSTDEF
jgi:hypothetical protein